MNLQNQTPRTLIFSQRNLSRIMPFRCPHFEFEDVIAEIDTAELVSPRFAFGTFRHMLTKQIAYHTPFVMNPGIESKPLQKTYDLFFAIFGNPTDLQLLHALGDWRSKCRKAVCLIDELWVRQLRDYRRFSTMLKQFDLVVLYYSRTVEPLASQVGVPCIFLPPGVDAIRFCPYPNPPRRVVDVYSIGRRSEVTHRALLEAVKRDNLFYLYDSLAANQVPNSTEHRLLFANVVKRSRYFIVNPGLIDQPEIRGDQIEIGNRYFEGAASGALMIGVRPTNGQFNKYFDWPDVMIDLPWDSAEITRVIREFDTDPSRQASIRRRNIEHSLLRHDWLYRWEAILDAVGMEGLLQAQTRKDRLLRLAALAAADASQSSLMSSTHRSEPASVRATANPRQMIG